MTIGLTLGLYLARRVALAVLAMLVALSALVSLFDVLELLRRAAQRPQVGLSLVFEIGALRLPFIALQILPFAVLLGGILAFWRLTRSSELVVVRAAGVSAWGFLAGPLLVAIGFGLLATILSPFSAATFARAERLENAHLRSGAGLSALAGGRPGCARPIAASTPLGWRFCRAGRYPPRRRESSCCARCRYGGCRRRIGHARADRSAARPGWCPAPPAAGGRPPLRRGAPPQRPRHLSAAHRT